MSFSLTEIDEAEFDRLAAMEESHFFELKSADKFEPISKSLSAFGNADGGRLIVGASDPRSTRGKIMGYANQEAANGHVTEITNMFKNAPDAITISFLKVRGFSDLLLDIEIGKSPATIECPDGSIYLRNNAQNKKLRGMEIQQLGWRKGQNSFEDTVTEEPGSALGTSDIFEVYRQNTIPLADPNNYASREKLVKDGKATVAGVLLFDDLPQATVTQAAVKIYRYRSLEAEGKREDLAGQPITLEGPAHTLVYSAVNKTKEIIEEIQVVGKDGFEQIKYPAEAIHEVVCNAIIHRDYSVHDYIHIRVFDNRVEVESPGRLAGHITKKNILTHRFARNKRIVRILNKFPNPPNKDVGEGLNTTFRSMRDMNLKDPVIEERENSLCVILAHEPLASKEKLIQEYLQKYGAIGNTKGREICFEPSESRMRKIFQKMIEAKILEKVPETRGKGTRYRLVSGKN